MQGAAFLKCIHYHQSNVVYYIVQFCMCYPAPIQHDFKLVQPNSTCNVLLTASRARVKVVLSFLSQHPLLTPAGCRTTTSLPLELTRRRSRVNPSYKPRRMPKVPTCIQHWAIHLCFRFAIPAFQDILFNTGWTSIQCLVGRLSCRRSYLHMYYATFQDLRLCSLCC